MEKYLLSVILDERKGLFTSLLRPILLVLSGIYYLVLKIIQLLYKLKILRKVRLKARVISVGNLTVGGTGKTPAVERIAGLLQKRGRRVAILSRGYKSQVAGRRSQVAAVSDGKEILLSAREAGDEPYLLAQNLSGVPIIVGKDRIKSGDYSLANFDTEAFILDDGFQYQRLERNLDILLINSLNPFGNGHLLPRGTLREPLRSLKRADLFILTRTDQAGNLAGLRERIRSINLVAPILESIHAPCYLEDLKSKRRLDLEFIENKEILALSSIAHPESFEKTLKDLRAIIMKRLRYSDHYLYTKEDLKEITSKARGCLIITTQKDGVRLEPLLENESILALRIELRVTRGQEVLERML
ncbi:MAG TPA: tetraacyldisaccharide 4'-kinase [bacterium]|nr:tetraacyldisaccharide 4'-kinase [bacterium]